MSLVEVLSAKLIKRAYGPWWLHEHWCPGCEMMHQIAVVQPFRNGARWSYNDDPSAPTFSPSVNIAPGTPNQCHYFIENGEIRYCDDSKHALAGQTVPLPCIPAEELES